MWFYFVTFQLIIIFYFSNLVFYDHNFPAVTVGFEAVVLTVPEDAGNVFIPVTVSQDVLEPITVDILYQDGSAMKRSGILESR